MGYGVDESIKNLQKIGALLKYREVNGTFPSYVLVYRDGVSDGQFDVVREMEIPQLKRAFLEVDTEYKFVKYV